MSASIKFFKLPFFGDAPSSEYILTKLSILSFPRRRLAMKNNPDNGLSSGSIFPKEVDSIKSILIIKMK